MSNAAFIELIKERFKDSILDVIGILNDDVIFIIKKEDIRNTIKTLKEDPDLGFSLSNHFAVDYEDSLSVVYNLYSYTLNKKITLKAYLTKEDAAVDSIEQIFKGAGWFERETFDMFGIRYNGLSRHERLLLPSDWEGYPLRKDYKFPDSYRGITLERTDSFLEDK